MNGSFFRQPPLRDAQYLAYVRTLPCCGCGFHGEQQAHHAIGQRYSSAKASDLHTLPLCPDCHRLLHAGWTRWEEDHGSQWMHVARTLETARAAGVLTIDHKAILRAA